MKIKRKPFLIGFLITIPLLILISMYADSVVYLIDSRAYTLDAAKKDAFRATAKLMVTTTKAYLSQNKDKIPIDGKGTYYMLYELDLNDILDNAYEDKYDINNSYVIVVNDNGTLRYYVTVKGDNMSIDLSLENDININKNKKVTSIKDVKIDGFKLYK